jgi:hypothetical protein
MDTYRVIIKKIMNTDNNIFAYNYKNDGVDGLCKILFSSLLEKQIKTKNKFKFFNESINNFIFKADNVKREIFIYNFYTIQRINNAFKKICVLYKYKKSKIVVNTDMGLNELTYNSKNVMCILQNNSRYLFYINDLIKIINNALTNSYMFFAEPLPIKNPYSNIPFNKSTLYNIYFFIKENTHIYAELLFKFFKCDFNLSIFKTINEYTLREYAINNYVYKSNSQTILDEIKNMLAYFNNYCTRNNLNYKISVDDDFPKNKLIKVLNPYLLLYFKYQYSFLEHVKSNSFYIFIRGLLRLAKFNPSFGKKSLKFRYEYSSDFKRKHYKKYIEFSDNCPPFNNVEKQNEEFLYDHLKIETERNIYDNIISYNSPISRYINISEETKESEDGSEDGSEEDDDEETYAENNILNEEPYVELDDESI